MVNRDPHRSSVVLGLALLVTAASVHAAGTPEQCTANKNKEAGKYAACRHKAVAKYPGAGPTQTTAFQTCLGKFLTKWSAFEQKAQGACLTNGDDSAIHDVLDANQLNISGALAGGALQNCPADLSSCQGSLATCSATAATCQSALAICQATPSGQLERTGQTTCWDDLGAPLSCAGTGQDGELQKGLARAYIDNGDGTITDTRTGLMWEKLCDDGSIHDKDNNYTWSQAFARAATLNAGGGFAGHTDWRVPNQVELFSLVNLGVPNPAISAPFNAGCVPGCSVTTCSCTLVDSYWSSSTFLALPSTGWNVLFNGGFVSFADKATPYRARAVRGGV